MITPSKPKPESVRDTQGEIMMKTKQMEVFFLKSIRFGYEVIHTDQYLGEGTDYALLGSGTATITMLPEEEVVKKQVDALEKSKQVVLAKCQLEVESIDDKIQSLLAIGHEGVEV